MIKPNPPASTISLVFKEFQIEFFWDALTIYDGEGIGAPMIGTAMSGIFEAFFLIHFCTGSFLPYPIISTSGALTLHFHSDSSVELIGFDAEYTATGMYCEFSAHLKDECPSSCSNSGFCRNGQCYCHNGRAGVDCSESKHAKETWILIFFQWHL